MFKKQLPIIFIGLCVVIAVLVLGWSVFVKREVVVLVKPPVMMDDNNHNGGSSEVVDDSSDAEDDVVDDNNISEIDTSDWKTYQNEEFGFEIKYLKDSWKISAEEFNDRWGKTVLGYIVISSNDIKDPFYAPIAITIRKNEKRLSIKKWHQENYPKEDISKLQKVKFNEVDGMRRLSDWSGGIDSFYFSNEDKIYSVSALDLQRNVENQRMMTEKMLSTFKFIKKYDTLDWKVYQNKKLGYELKYPSDWFTYDYYYDGEKHSEDIYIQNFSRPEEGGFSGIGGTGCQLSVWVESDKYSSIQEWINVRKNNIGEDLEKVSIKEIGIGEAKGLEVTFSGEFLGTGDPVIVILNNRIIYKINESWQNVSQKNCQLIFNQILSTFKFTNP